MFEGQGTKKNLQVIIENVEFARKFHYYISVSIKGDTVRRRTDISDKQTNPIFE